MVTIPQLLCHVRIKDVVPLENSRSVGFTFYTYLNWISVLDLPSPLHFLISIKNRAIRSGTEAGGCLQALYPPQIPSQTAKMRFSTAICAIASAALAAAQSNPFTMATVPTSISAGTVYNITWNPTTSGTVSLWLVQASGPGSTIVHYVSTIAGKSSSPTFPVSQILPMIQLTNSPDSQYH